MLTEWIFTNRCKAYVDKDGIALEGEALEQAKREKNAPRCNHRVTLGSKCCPMCGAPAPGGWWTCAKCGRKIGNDSAVCSYCGTEQNISHRSQLKAGVWHPEEGIIAQRFELNAYKDVLFNGLDVQTGQVCLLLVGGELERVLTPGNYTLENLQQAGVTAENRATASLVFIRDGELDFPIQLMDLRTQEGLDAESTLSAVVSFDHSLMGSFLGNVMTNDQYVSGRPQTATFSMDSLALNILIPEVDIVVRQFCFAHTADELFMKSELALELEAMVNERLKRRLQSVGLMFIRLGRVVFHGKVFDELRKMSGDIEGMRREQEYRLRADALEKSLSKQLSNQDAEHEKYLKQLAQEMEVSDAVRDQELARLHEKMHLERELAALEERRQLAAKELTDVAELEKLQDQYDEERKKIVKDGEIERRKMEHNERIRQLESEMACAFDSSKLKNELKKLANETEHARVMQWLEEQAEANKIKDASDSSFFSYLQNCNSQTQMVMLLARYPNMTPAQLEMIMENNKVCMSAGMTPEQLVAFGVSMGKTTADALTALRPEKRDELYEKAIQTIRSDYQKLLERDERMFTKGTEAAAAARVNATGATTVTTQVLK